MTPAPRLRKPRQQDSATIVVAFAINLARTNLADCKPSEVMRLREGLSTALGREGPRVVGVRVGHLVHWPFDGLAPAAYAVAEFRSLQEDVAAVLKTVCVPKASRTLARMNLGTLRLMLLPYRDRSVLSVTGTVRDTFMFLLASALTQVPNTIVGRCPNCDRVFLATGKRRYCDRACTNRASMRTWLAVPRSADMATAPTAGITGPRKQAEYRKLLPRIYELKDLATTSDPDAWPQNLEDGLGTIKSKRAAFEKLERQLAVLDDESWLDLKSRAAVVLQERDLGRGWRMLFDIFSEARAFGYLVSTGCSEVRFIQRAEDKTPDLQATKDESPVLCEVKTLNISKGEAERRQRVHAGEISAVSTKAHLDNGFLNKLGSTLKEAVEQLDAVDPERKAQRIVFMVVHFDDWVGDYQPEYFAEMDTHLSQNPVPGAELVFCAASNLFERTFTMKSATVLSE